MVCTVVRKQDQRARFNVSIQSQFIFLCLWIQSMLINMDLFLSLSTVAFFGEIVFRILFFLLAVKWSEMLSFPRLSKLCTLEQIKMQINK